MMYRVYVGSDESGGRYSRPLEIGRFADLQEAVRFAIPHAKRAWIEAPDGLCFYLNSPGLGWIQPPQPAR